MSDHEPSYLPMGVNFLGFLAQELGDLSGAGTLAHELIQNADDAKNDEGELCASEIIFDVRDDALVVRNDAVFREVDFGRIREVASSAKRYEEGERTTGAFGVGFISVYQITDRPEIHSVGRRLVFKPDNVEDKRAMVWNDPTVTRDKGTLFKLPWAFDQSTVREVLKAPTIDAAYIDSFIEELRKAIPQAVLFLKQVRKIELQRNGVSVRQATRTVEGDYTVVRCDGTEQRWKVFEGDFRRVAQQLKARSGTAIDPNRSSVVRVAVLGSGAVNGLLFATLPTQQPTGLPFHIDADFFPHSDRKTIRFDARGDFVSQWNREALKTAASVVAANVIPIRDLFGDNFGEFWRFLSVLHETDRVHRSDAQMPLDNFWQELAPALKRAPVVRSESGNWLKPIDVRIATGRDEESAVEVFGEIGIEIVDRSLRSYRNVLTSRDVGVTTITASGVADALQRKGMVKRAQPLPAVFQRREALEQLWRGINSVLENTPQASTQSSVKRLKECTLAPGEDGQLWPCHSAIRADAQTRSIFTGCLPDGFTLMVEDDVPLLQRICLPLSAETAIRLLESLAWDDLQARWMNRSLDPARLLRWFDAHKSQLDAGLRHRLAGLSLFPSGGRLCRLMDLWLPGGFQAPAGVAGLVDMRALGGLSDFLEHIGAKKLTFENYASRYVAAAFAPGSQAGLEQRREHLAVLQRHIGEIKGNRQLREQLSAAHIVECTDGVFRPPSQVYFATRQVEDVLGNRVSYAALPRSSPGPRDLYEWLGVAAEVRARDILAVIESIIKTPPTKVAKSAVVRMLMALNEAWPRLNDAEKAAVSRLREMEWLPAEGDDQRWHRPDGLYTVYNKHLFASQARFFDVPYQVQQATSSLLQFLRMPLYPNPAQVKDHLLWRVKRGEAPPNGVYVWLDQNAGPADLRDLRNTACLWTGDVYLSPADCYRGPHVFGRFRFQLGPNLLSCQHLLQALGVKESPEPEDVVSVLRDVAGAVGNNPLTEEDRGVVLQCWVELSNALEGEAIDRNGIASMLHDIPSVPNEAGLMQRPGWVFFEDRPGLLEKFPDLLAGNCIPKRERIWRAMEAAGVQPLSTVISSYLDHPLNPREAVEIGERVSERIELVREILEPSVDRTEWNTGGVPVETLRFFRSDQLTVTWELEAFGHKWPRTAPEGAQAHFNVGHEILYFVPGAGGVFPWAAIAREMTFAVAPQEDIKAIAPGLRMVLEAETFEDAIAQAEELGIARIRGLGNLSAQGSTADLDDDHFAGDGYQDEFDDSADGSASDDRGGASPPSDPFNDQRDDPPVPFAQKLYEVQTVESSRASQRRVFLPTGGPQTDESARRHTQASVRVGRSGSYVSRTVSRWEPVEAANELAERFRAMVSGDYGHRCQICSRTFTLPGGSLQVYVVHVVPPSADHRTNHFGDLLGLCGWHYSLIRYGEWALVDPNTHQPFVDSDGSEGWEHLQRFVERADRSVDDFGNDYVGLNIRFSNIYQDWLSDPTDVEEEVRYSVPHWKYLRELLQA